MNITRRQGAVFTAGLVLAAVALVLAWRLAASPTLANKPDALASPQPSALARAQELSTCPLQPAVAIANEKDGQFPLQSDLVGLTATEIGSFIVIGKESASAGRPRDAEVAFLMSCRLANKLKGGSSVESADAKYQLGWHYATLTFDDPSGSAAVAYAELLWRAQLLYSDSLNAYSAKFGESHEKTRLAAEGLASVRQTLAQAPTAPLPTAAVTAKAQLAHKASPAAARRPANSVAPGSAPRQTGLAKAAPPSWQSPGADSRLRPSFDCRRARSLPEKMICSDAELARIDRELGRVYATAQKATPNRAAFQRQQDQEWLRRESTCRDRDCMLRWYAQRRDQLMNEMEGRRLSTTASR